MCAVLEVVVVAHADEALFFVSVKNGGCPADAADGVKVVVGR